MKNYKCCVCGHVMEEREIGLKFVKFTEQRMPLYQKLYCYFCTKCEEFRQVDDEGATI